MPTNYLLVNGMKIGHVKDGLRTDYLTDALGSVTATKNQSQHIVNTYRYKPYGGLLSRTGTGDDPKYLWTGNTGSRVTQTRNVNQYNVARHYANGHASWTSVDPLWPGERSYAYPFIPTIAIDPDGMLLILPRPVFSPPIPGRPPSPGMPGPYPIMDPDHDSFINQCSAIGWGMIIDDVKKWIWPEVEKDKRDRVVFLPPRLSYSDCQKLHHSYKRYCDQKRDCRGLTKPSDCGEMEKRRDDASQCARLRIEVIKYCDLRPPPNWGNPYCGHLQEACISMAHACGCGKKISSICVGGPPSPDEATCYSWMNFCNGHKQKCKFSFTFIYPPLN